MNQRSWTDHRSPFEFDISGSLIPNKIFIDKITDGSVNELQGQVTRTYLSGSAVISFL